MFQNNTTILNTLPNKSINLIKILMIKWLFLFVVMLKCEKHYEEDYWNPSLRAAAERGGEGGESG
jgi:hypothetical protein